MEKFKKLSRAEMKNVTGGVLCPCSNECNSNDDCPGKSDCEGPQVSCPNGGGCTYKVCSGRQ